MRYLCEKFAAAGFFAAMFAIVPANAQFSEEWRAAAAEMQAGCDNFERTLPVNGASPPAAGALDLPTRIYGQPLRPHMCVIMSFSIDAEGKTRDVEQIYKGPENLRYVYVRKAIGSVKKWRFNVENAPPGAYSQMYARIDLIPVGGRRYRINYNYWHGGPPDADVDETG